MIALLLACGGPPSHPYLEALEQLDPQPCLRLDQPAQGECVVSTAVDLAKAGRVDEAHAACTLTLGLWFDECHFQLADEVDAVFEDADALCDLAGRYRKPCLGHAIQREFQLLQLQELSEAELEARLVQRWSELVPPERAQQEARRMLEAREGGRP